MIAGKANSENEWRALLGRKVSIRFRLRGDPAHPFSEAVGVVQAVVASAEGGCIRVVKRRGELVEVPVGDILAAKVLA